MYIGSAYYPNRLSRAEVETDARLMKQAGFTVARMGDLVWDLMEPREGRYEFAWLRQAVEILAGAGLKSFLCTPTASIPKWMHDRHPDIMQLTAGGQQKPFGKRRHACINHPVYRDYCVKVATALAREFQDSGHVIAYQVDNELMAEEPYCYCSFCQAKFAGWLAAKYKTVEALNDAWNLSFWSQNLNSFDEIYLPRKGDNPSCYLNYQEFYSDCTIEFYNLQRDAIKAVCPGVSVSHNICSSGFLYLLDLYKLAKTCDFMSIDNYPYAWTLENEYGNRGAFTYTPHMASLALAQMRGAKAVPFWVTEAQIGRTVGNQRKLLEPGIVRLWSLQEMAQGATGIVYFPFKTFPAGHEHVMLGVLDEDNVPRRRFTEARQVAAETMKIRKITGQTMPVSRAAVIRDFRCDWAFEDTRFSVDFRYMREVFKYYRVLRNAGVTTDVISPLDSFDAYRLIVVPSQVLVNDDFCRRLKQAAEAGATIAMVCMTGLRNDDMRSFGRMLHASVEELAGIEMEEQHSLFAQEDVPVRLQNDPRPYNCGYWFDIFKLTSAEMLGTYESRFFQGRAVAARNRVGRGTVYYVGSVVQEQAAAAIVKQAIATAGISPLAVGASDLVELTETADTDGGRYVYALNYSAEVQTVALSARMTDVLTGEKFGESMPIHPMDYRVLRVDGKK